MKSIIETIIKESKDDEKIIDIFKKEDTNGSMIVSIAKKIQRWDANKNAFSRDPMFLIRTSKGALEWQRYEGIQHAVDDNEFKTFLEDSFNHVKEKAILGVFVDRCFLPICTEEEFNKVWNQISKNKSR